MSEKVEKINKSVRYAVLLAVKITEALAEEGSELNVERIVEEKSETEFIHALATIMPSSIYTRMTGDDVDGLGFNHIANRLCFQYGKIDDAENEKEL